MAKILLIEDIPDNVELVNRALSQTGYEVAYASDAETGLATALKLIPDLILLDLGLPDYDGQTLAGWLRQEESLNKTKIVALTAWPEETARKMVESYQCDGYISKPIMKISDFISQVNSYLINK
ncbi:MAG: response regulator [Anaerolineales bacterium]|jgi:CheY-like chemotaxis protein|nr:response regulator [Anaerolineales bacterium]MBX3037070.1 response regulator [Anaerolineales bacterium]